MSIAEAGILTNSLLNELAQSGLAVVDRRRVETAFGGFIDADRERLGQEVERHHALIAETYGEDLAGTFLTVDGIDVPITLESLNAQLADIATTALERERKRVEQLRGVAALNSKEREEFERLKALAQQKATGGRAKRRAAASKKGRKRKKPGR